MLEENVVLQSSGIIAAGDIIPVSAPENYPNIQLIVQTVLLQPALPHCTKCGTTKCQVNKTPLTQMLQPSQPRHLPPQHSMKQISVLQTAQT